ncbi:LysR family transcriptional regulator [Pseudothauera nasutitermitis]|uniref:LysR family transcriptional regulator n=1 Tax=Pseudothauera nasutitermitis TaxID=2565930 RepID=A0A4S4AVJ0_9RHOO|nr:LysR family transcriptional regulator [Pseudothauera nasutitermitis]THF63968.1 LysR family transcriptional regulator [Pseudothauera nasutitermitis]
MNDPERLHALLPDLAIFTRAAERLGFSAAARELGMTPSAVSRRIAHLEGALGVRLFERSTRKLRLSEAGQTLLAHCRSMLENARAALDGATAYRQSPHGRVRMSVPRAFGRRVIHPLVAPFLAAYPEVDVQLLVTDRAVDPFDDAVDLVVRITDAPPEGLAARPLLRVRQVLCATPDYLARRGTPAHPDELAAHDCLFLGEQPADRQWKFRRGEERATVGVRGRYVVNHAEMRLEGMLNHLGIGSLPHFVAAEDIARGQLVPVLEDWELLTAYQGTAYLLYPANRYLAPKCRVFIDWLAAQLGSGHGGPPDLP